MEWITDPAAWAGLLTLVALEIVLGVDNLIFLAILAEKLPAAQRDRARLVGLSLALVMRLGLLASISWVMSLTVPLLEFWRFSISWRDVILIAGGVFLLIKATTEIHERVQGEVGHHAATPAHSRFWAIIAQIIVLDAVFSLDSIITAVGMVDELGVMMTAVVVSVIAMLAASKPLTEFITKRPSLIILCLGFLLMIGLVLVVDGLGIHVPKSYVYAAIGFSLLVEILNQLAAHNRARLGVAIPPRQGIAEAVLRLLGGLPLQAEKHMVEEVLGLASRPVGAIMTPREEVTWLDAASAPDVLLAQLRASPHREFPVGRGSIDRVIGLVRKEELFAQCLDGRGIDVERMLHPPLTVAETSSVLDALSVFKREPAEMAVVLDARGAFKGVVTREDLLEAIAGDLPDSGRPQPVAA